MSLDISNEPKDFCKNYSETQDKHHLPKPLGLTLGDNLYVIIP